MEFNQVLGRARPFHYFATWRPVERAKIQAALEAARRASRGMNVPFFKAVVAYRDHFTQEERDRFKTAWEPDLFDLAPVYIFWFNDMESRLDYVDRMRRPSAPSGALQDTHIMAPMLGWSRRYLTEVILPEVLQPGGKSWDPMRGGNSDAAMAMQQAVLCALDDGLAATLIPFDEEGARSLLHFPETMEPMMAMLVGYPAESWTAGGQEPEYSPFEETFFEDTTEQGFRRDPEVTARMAAEGLIQEPAPVPWRQGEIRGLDRMFHRTAGKRGPA